MTGAAPLVYSPAELAKAWGCSERHIRNMVDRGELQAFRMGQKLIRIPAKAVEDYQCQNTLSRGSAGAGQSRGTKERERTDAGTAIRLARMIARSR